MKDHSLMHKVNYTAGIYRVGSKLKLTSLQAGQAFDMAITVRDMRPKGTYTYRGITKPLVRGVFAAYCDVLYDKSRAYVLGLSANYSAAEFLSAFTFSPSYPNGTLAFDAPDRINELGAFAWSFSGMGGAAVEVVRVRMKAKGVGELTFTPDISQLPHPMCDTLVYGNHAAEPPEDSWLKPDEILCVGVKIQVD